MHASKEEQKSLVQLKKRAEFLRVQKQGQKWVSHGLIIQVAPNETEERRVGYTVTKKTEKSSVRRNRIKRRLRAVAADILPGFAKAGYDYVLIGRSASMVRPYQTLCDDLKWCLGKLDRLKDI